MGYWGVTARPFVTVALTAFLTVGLSSVFALARSGGQARSRQAYSIELNARSVFWLLPPTIFENTAAGLSADEKYELFMQGTTEHWTIRESTPDLLEIVSRPEGDATVLVRIFRVSGGKAVVAAMGTDTGSVCATELWNVDKKGRATPVDAPDEPDIMDFFTPGTRVPPDVTASLPFCVQPEGLEVRPLFWASTGLAHVMVDRAVFYIWTGKRFSKRIVPLPPYPSPSSPLPQDPAQLSTLPGAFFNDTLESIPEKFPALDSDGLPLSLPNSAVE